MNKIIKKVTSRKFLLACIVFITMILIAAGADVATVKSVVAIIVAGVNCAIYIAGEAAIDAKGVKTAEIESEIARLTEIAEQISGGIDYADNDDT